MGNNKKISLQFVLLTLFSLLYPTLSNAKPARYPEYDNSCVWVTHTASLDYAEDWRGYSTFSLIPHTGLNPQYLVKRTAGYTGTINNEEFYYIGTQIQSYNPATTQLDVINSPITGTVRIKKADISILQANSTLASAPKPDVSSNLSGWCDPDPCQAKQGQNKYDLRTHIQTAPPTTGDSCYENCKQTAEILWTDCLSSDDCVSSVKYTYTGAPCAGQPVNTDLEDTQPTRCNEQLETKIAECGGSLNVQGFNFETCTGVCAPDNCHSAWLAQVKKCGGIMAVSTWNSDSCTGTCASDIVPTIENPPDGLSPGDIQSGNTENPDGTSSTTTTTTYNFQGTEYTEIKTTTYDALGNPTGTTVKTVQANQNSDIGKKQLAALEGIKDKLDELTDDETPSLPAQPEYDGTIPDLKNWAEYDNAQQVGQAKANREIAAMEQQTIPDAFSIELDTSGSTPYLHGPMFGKEIYIRFDRPWMLTGYQIMNATLIGIGYLQAAMMVHRVVTGA